MNITDYLLLSEQARWAKEKGFDGECERFYNSFAKQENRHAVTKNSDVLHKYSYSIPTFDQFFDWVEEKWGIEIKQGIANGQEGRYFAHGWDFVECEHLWFSKYYPTKRAARIAAVEAIINYVNSLPNE